MKDYYSILGLSPGASKDAIKKAYRSLAMKWHPDKNSSLEAKQKFIIYTEAYDALMSGKTFSFKNPFQQTKQKPKPKTSEELRRERALKNYELLQNKFLGLRKKYNDPRYRVAKKKEMYGKSNRYFLLSTIILVGSISFPFIIGNPGLLLTMVPIGLAFSVRTFFIGGRKKMQADMLFSEEENYSMEELRDFFNMDSDLGIRSNVASDFY